MYAREIALALARCAPEHEWVWWLERFRRRGAVPLEVPDGVRLCSGPMPSIVSTALARFGLGPDRRVGGVDVVHATDYVAPPPLRAPLVATIHDVLFETLPDCFTARMRAGLRSATRRLVRAARRLIVPSARTRDQVVAWYDADPDRVDVVPHGVRPLPPVEPAAGEGRYVLFVGTLEPRKNLARLLDAFQGLPASDARLLVAGPRAGATTTSCAA